MTSSLCLLLSCSDAPLHNNNAGRDLQPVLRDAAQAVFDATNRNDSGKTDASVLADAAVSDAAEPLSDAGSQPQPAFKRFVAIGDVGTGGDKQHRVAEAIERVCAELGGCDFGLLLGDNFYNSGVDSDTDSLWRSHFELPYGGDEHACSAVQGEQASHDLGFPFYAVLGNHDLGGNGLGLDMDLFKAQHQISYGRRNPQWLMPARYYSADLDPVFLVGLNTTAMFFDQADDQAAEVRGYLDNAPAERWKIAFGHHPYISNGPHGNAGDYERIPSILQRLTPNWTYFRGTYVQRFMEDQVCGRVDLYLAGHDHSRQDLGNRCGTDFWVSGAGAKTTDLDDGDNTAIWQSASVGFSLIEASSTELVMRMYSATGELEHERILRR
jgi:tartrate-resistant acid phosphatase type 5